MEDEASTGGLTELLDCSSSAKRTVRSPLASPDLRLALGVELDDDEGGDDERDGDGVVVVVESGGT